MAEFYGWAPEGLHDAKGPDLAVRTVYEARLLQRALRTALTFEADTGAEIGCGYGRLTPVLADFCRSVVGFEREPLLVQKARAIHRDASFAQVPNLWSLPVSASSIDALFTFTVLQHMSAEHVHSTLHEVDRVMSDRGVAVLVEADGDTDESTIDYERLFTIGRPAEFYSKLLPHFRLMTVLPRVLEKGTWAGDGVVGNAIVLCRE
jgi:SAM-dependent methyltransferase